MFNSYIPMLTAIKSIVSENRVNDIKTYELSFKNEINYNIELCTQNEQIINGIAEKKTFFPLYPFWHFAWDDWRGYYSKVPHTSASYTYIWLINKQIELRPGNVNDVIHYDKSILYNLEIGIFSNYVTEDSIFEYERLVFHHT